MCDPFDKNWPDGVRVMFSTSDRSTPHLTWLLLTKRIGNVHAHGRCPRATRWLREWLALCCRARITSGLARRSSIRPEADRDVPKLRRLPAAVRFLSIEPMLGPIDLSRWLLYQVRRGVAVVTPTHRRAALHWVIAGGESGPKARPAQAGLVPAALRDQCAAAGLPFIFKQWGEWVPDRQQGKHAALAVLSNQPIPPTVYLRELDATTRATKVGKKAAGRLLDGVTHDGFPGAAP
jgi:protein gp37